MNTCKIPSACPVAGVVGVLIIVLLFLPCAGYGQTPPADDIVFPDAAILPTQEEGLDLHLRSQITLDLSASATRYVLESASYNPVIINLPDSASQQPSPDLPPASSLVGGLRYTLTSEVFPADDGNHLQLWLWDSRDQHLVYTDELVCEYEVDEDTNILMGTMVAWIFSHIKEDPPEEPPSPVEEPAPQVVEELPPPVEEAPVVNIPPPEDTSILKGMYIDIAPQYYIMPVGLGGIFYRVSSYLPGFRVGAGILFALGPGDLGLGLEAGYNHLIFTLGDITWRVNAVSYFFKAEYTIPLPWYGLTLRPSLGIGWLRDMDPLLNKFTDFILAGRLYLHWPFTPFLDESSLSLYLGGGVDVLPERRGLILMPTVELGLRWLPLSMK